MITYLVYRVDKLHIHRHPVMCESMCDNSFFTRAGGAASKFTHLTGHSEGTRSQVSERIQQWLQLTSRGERTCKIWGQRKWGAKKAQVEWRRKKSPSVSSSNGRGRFYGLWKDLRCKTLAHSVFSHTPRLASFLLVYQLPSHSGDCCIHQLLASLYLPHTTFIPLSLSPVFNIIFHLFFVSLIVLNVKTISSVKQDTLLQWWRYLWSASTLSLSLVSFVISCELPFYIQRGLLRTPCASPFGFFPLTLSLSLLHRPLRYEVRKEESHFLTPSRSVLKKTESTTRLAHLVFASRNIDHTASSRTQSVNVEVTIITRSIPHHCLLSDIQTSA